MPKDLSLSIAGFTVGRSLSLPMITATFFAERQRRESILRAEGQKRSQILIAEGEKEAAILKAQAEKESAILRADAVREQKIREADGEANAILKVQQAYADSLRMLNEAAPTDKVLTLKSFEALAKVADGKATKLIIPSQMQSIAGLAASIKEVVTDQAPEEPQQ